MVLAAYNDTGSKIMVFLHILAVIVAFSPSFVWTFVSVRMKKEGRTDVGRTINALAGGNTAKIYGPAMAVAGLIGFGIAGMSKIPGTDELYFAMSQTWLSIGAACWLVALGVMFGIMAPAEKAIAAGDTAAEKKLAMAGGILHLTLAVALFAMVFKPGL